MPVLNITRFTITADRSKVEAFSSGYYTSPGASPRTRIPSGT